MLPALTHSIYLPYRAARNLIEHGGVELAGYLTFLSMLSVFPFLVIVIAIAGYLGQGDAGVRVIHLLLSSLPADMIDAIRPRMDEIISGPPEGLLTLSILSAIWTASSAVEGLRTALNRAYRVSDPPAYLVRRMLSMLQVLLFGALMMVFMLGLLFLPVLLDFISHLTGIMIPYSLKLFLARDFVYAGGLAIFLGVASLYFVLPNIKQSLLAVLPGAGVCVVLWVLGAQGLSYYLSHISDANMIYGSLSGFIATLLFFFVMNLIFIFGAEFNSQIIARLHIPVEEIENKNKH